MSNYTEEINRRRTFAIISHPDAGKTTLTEKFLLYGGAINLAGSVKGKATARHAVSDWMQIEKDRGISVTSSVLQFEYDGYCINILDTPGHQDFSENQQSAARTNLSVGEAFVRGILCNILVCIAVWMSFAAKRVSGKLLTSYWPVMLFVLCGFEHSIADMYFGVCGLLTAQAYGITAESLTWFNFLVKALLPITLGNIVGGAGIVGCGYWLAYLHRTPYSADTTAAEQEEIDIAEEY